MQEWVTSFVYTTGCTWTRLFLKELQFAALDGQEELQQFQFRGAYSLMRLLCFDV